jgi:hypothetical protein
MLEFEYEGISGIAFFFKEDKRYSGRLLGVNNVWLFGGNTEQETEFSFRDTVIRYKKSIKIL